MKEFYPENIDLPEKTTRNINGKRFYSFEPRCSGHLDKILDYYIIRDHPIVVGVYQYTTITNKVVSTVTAYETIDLETGMVLPVSHEYSLLAKHIVYSGKLSKRATFLGAYKPLDPELHIKIKNKCEQRFNKNNK
ncbi:MAG: hypothetical protein ACRC7D_14995 [Aeromonas popoffii]|uniref:hypothetical protein n=1 Tax=Aeromonas popoffii TaxID=70856 RepID=UPI003F359E74